MGQCIGNIEGFTRVLKLIVQKPLNASVHCPHVGLDRAEQSSGGLGEVLNR